MTKRSKSLDEQLGQEESAAPIATAEAAAEASGLVLPVPEEAKVAELTAYCKAIGKYPDGWAAMKADEKRKAFRRFFMPEATSSFDPGDPLHLASEAVENLEPQGVEALVSKLAEDVGLNYFRLGGVLLRVSSGWYFDEFKFESFKEWLAAKTDLKYGKSRYLIRVYQRLVELEIPWTDVRDIGWTKLATIVDLLTEDEWRYWFDQARELGKAELREAAKRAKAGGAAGDEGSSTESTGVKKVSFPLHEDQLEVVEEALREVGERNPGKDRSTCLEYVCADFLSGLDEPAAGAAPKAPKTLEAAKPQVLALFKALRKAAGDDLEGALQVVVDGLNEHFSEAEVEVSL